MTKQDLQKELKEKVREGIKPSHLKRSKSLNDIQANTELTLLQTENKELKKQISEWEIRNIENISIVGDQNREVFVDALEDNPSELKAKISQLEDQILQLRLEKIKEFGEYYEKKQKLEKDLESNVNYGVKEIERLETKLRTINKKKLELEQKLGQSQSEKARLEIKLINAENKEPITPNFWTDYGPLILLSILTALSIWLSNKNTAKYNNQS